MSSTARDRKTKTVLRFQLSPMRTAVTNGTNDSSAFGRVGKANPDFPLAGMALLYVNIRDWEVPTKLKTRKVASVQEITLIWKEGFKKQKNLKRWLITDSSDTLPSQTADAMTPQSAEML
ncbi:hypothetical protein STEG23_026600 [Scotinomys teguina]